MKFLVLLVGFLCACSAEPVSPTTPPGILATLAVPTNIAVGQTVSIRLSLKNSTSDPIPVRLGIDKSLAFDPAVTSSDGTRIWSRLAGTVTAGVAETIVIGPGEVEDFDATWSLKRQDGSFVPAGVYTVEARLVGDGDNVILSGISSRIQVVNAASD